MRNPADQRHASLSAAVEAHGWKPIIERLRWLQDIHGNPSKYADVISADIKFMVVTYERTSANPKKWFLLGAVVALAIGVPVTIIVARGMKKK